MDRYAVHKDGQRMAIAAPGDSWWVFDVPDKSSHGFVSDHELDKDQWRRLFQATERDLVAETLDSLLWAVEHSAISLRWLRDGVAKSNDRRDEAAATGAFIIDVLDIFCRIDCHEDLFWNTTLPGVPLLLSVQCGTTFAQGGADAETITSDNVEVLRQVVADLKPFEDAGTVEFAYTYVGPLFAARVRGMRPRSGFYKPSNEALWPLFDACGPARDTPTPQPEPAP